MRPYIGISLIQSNTEPNLPHIRFDRINPQFGFDAAQIDAQNNVKDGDVIPLSASVDLGLRLAYQKAVTPQGSSIGCVGLATSAGMFAGIVAAQHAPGIERISIGLAASAIAAVGIAHQGANQRVEAVTRAYQHFVRLQHEFIEHILLDAYKAASARLIDESNAAIATGQGIPLTTLAKLTRFGGDVIDQACDQLQISVMQIRHMLDKQANIISVEGPHTYRSLGLDPQNPAHQTQLLEALIEADMEREGDFLSSDLDYAEWHMRNFVRGSTPRMAGHTELPHPVAIYNLRQIFTLAYSKGERFIPPLPQMPDEIELMPFPTIMNLDDRLASYENVAGRLDVPALDRNFR